jgi:hypothetical protein
MLYRVVRKPHGRLENCISGVRPPLLHGNRKHFITSRVNPIRVLIFNCTHGRSGTSFLETVLAKVATQLQLHGSAEAPHAFFDKVVFCTNVTYADGHFKGGKIRSLLCFTAVSCVADTCHFPQT